MRAILSRAQCVNFYVALTAYGDSLISNTMLKMALLFGPHTSGYWIYR